MATILLVPWRRSGAGFDRFRSVVLAAAICAVLLPGVAGCKADAELKPFQITGLETLPDQSLANAVSRYYAAEAARKWSTLYQLQHPAFRRKVSRDAFIQSMRRDWKLWHFNGVAIEGVQGVSGVGGSVNVSLIFEEVVMSQDVALKHDVIWFPRPWWDDKPRIEARTRSISSWTRENGRWYPIRAGLRGHVTYDLQSFD